MTAAMSPLVSCNSMNNETSAQIVLDSNLAVKNARKALFREMVENEKNRH